MNLLAADADKRDLRRGACPALSAPMQTGDGLLARISFAESIRPAELATICRLCEAHGNGVINISARGNLQVRGLTTETAGKLEGDIRSLNLPLREGLAVEVPPLAGLDPAEIADPRPLADAIRARAHSLEGLAPKISVVVDGSGRMRLSQLLADIRLVAARLGDKVGWQILLGDTQAGSRVHGTFPAQQAVDEALSLLQRLTSLGPTSRGRDLVTDAMPPCAMMEDGFSSLGVTLLEGDEAAVGIGLPFGQTTAVQLAALCTEAKKQHIRAVRPAFGHALILFGDRSACETIQVFAGRCGFITESTDARGMIAACPGSPSCASAAIDTHGLAHLALEHLEDLLDGSFNLHVTGCAKGCAHPQATSLALCGGGSDISFIVGKASDPSFASIPAAESANALRSIAALVRKERLKDETSAACIARLGREQLALSLTSGRT
ncbi:precorrin-3B synthase [Pseudorhizobium flavum]|uniref:precorrin-3B synthase n=1 Tax=Pseudorhizobium flavum TaxID=1335061 RepID=UPI0037704567